jgi:DNA invertase Pin-like site-specific DNA recombinase
MLGVFAEFERSLIVEGVRGGIARAKREGISPNFRDPSRLAHAMQLR